MTLWSYATKAFLMALSEERRPEQLWDRAKQGERAALGALYDRLVPPIEGMLLHILADHKAAQEVLGEVLERLWRESRSGECQSGSLAVLVTLMARYAAVDRLRTRESRPALDRSQFDSLTASRAWLPDSATASAVDERRDLLKRVLKQLPESQRRAVEMVVFEGYSEEELAGKMGVPLGRAKAELRAAMRFLRHRLRAVRGTWSVNI